MLALSRRTAVAWAAGALATVALLASPAAASADTGPFIPVRLSPSGGQAANPTTYLARVPGAFALVNRNHEGVRLYVHDPGGLVPGSPVVIVIFNHPEHCAPADTPGKSVFDPSGQRVALCDPAVDAHNPATGFAAITPPGAPKVALDRWGNFRLTVPAGAALTNPHGAEVAVFEIASRHIMFATPRLRDDG